MFPYINFSVTLQLLFWRIPEAYAKETIVLPLNDINAVKEAVNTYKNQIAVVAIEPIPANNGLLIQDV